MVKEKRILSYFIGWLLLGFIVCFIGVNKIFANTTGFWGPKTTQPSQAYFYDCTSSGCNTITTSTNGIGYDGSNNQYGIYWTNLTTVAGSYGGMVAIRTSTPLLADKIYSTTVYMCAGSSYIVPKNLYSGSLDNIKSRSYPVNQLTGWGNADLGSYYPYQRIELGEAISNPVINNCRAVSFIYTPKVNSNFIGFNFTTGNTVTTNQYLIGYDHEYLGDSNNLSEEQVDTIINNQTNEINTSINNMQENISSDIKDSESNITNSITDSQNSINENIDEMTDSINGTLNDSLNNCRDSYNLLNPAITSTTKNGVTLTYDSNSQTITLNGTCTTDNTTFVFPGSVNIPSGKTAYVGINYVSGSSTGYMRLGLFDSDWHTYNQLSVVTESGLSGNIKNSYKTTANTSYVNNNIRLNNGSSFNNLKFKVFVSYETSTYEEYNKQVCVSKIDETNDKLDETNNQLGDLNNNLTDSSAPNTSGLENSAGWLPAGPLDSVLNLPLSLFNALTTNLNKSCNPINIPLPYVNKNITLPCINTLYNQIGITSFLSWIGVIVSGLMLYTYLLKLYKWIEDRISLNETHNVDSWGGL